MLPPEVTRIVLLIGLAATAYLMILAWNDDMQAAKEVPTYSAAPLTDAPAAVTPPTMDVPTIAEVGENPDIPVVADGETEVVETESAVATESSSLVTVFTPTLKVWIDTLGGNIVRVQLPSFPIDLEHPDIPYLLLERNATHTYVAESGLAGKDGTHVKGRPRYQPAMMHYDVLEGDTVDVVLTYRNEDVDVTKIFTFRGDDHLVDVRYAVKNASSTPKHMAMFAQIRRDAKSPPTDESFALAPQPYVGAAVTTPEERYKKIDFEDIEDEGSIRDENIQGGWVAFLQHYFVSAWIPPADQVHDYDARRGRDGLYRFSYAAKSRAIQPGEVGEWHSQFYAGPKDQKRLEDISPNLNLTVDYGFLWWLAVPLFAILDWLHGLVGNWGLAIILLTVVVKAALYPLSAAGYKSMANMRRVAPAMKRLQERYGNDREKLSREMMALYKKENANPLGGCLPMLLPMPIFIALYWVLFESVELRQAPFFGWIEDLAVMDPYFILPLLMGGSMYYMQTLNPQVGDPMQVRMMKMMPIMFTVLFLFFPAGLVLYWLVNNILSVAQQQFVYKQVEKAQAAGAKG
ncbi:MAG: membrane protein insertase YidC [Pseudomonadota bacterium]